MPSIGTGWLRIEDIIPILKEEIKDGGFEWVYDNKLYALPTGQKLLLTVYCNKSDFGFIFKQGHNAFSEKKDREFFRKPYYSCFYTAGGKSECDKIENMPTNIFVLEENCYWFQFTKKDENDSRLLSKDIAIKILRQDIRKYLSTVKK